MVALDAAQGFISMDKWMRYRGYLILTLIYAILFGGYIAYERRPRPEPILLTQPTAAPTATPAPLQVYIVGAVQHPGLYALPPASRLAHAVEAAGGLSEEADAEAVNLADLLRDGQQVYIPKRGTPPPPAPTPLGGAAPQQASASGAPSAAGTININTASAAELESLPGIGPALAQRIVAYREEHGPFASPEQIMEVAGIGQGRYEQIKGQITVR